LPNIQGLAVYAPLQEGVGTTKFGWNRAPRPRSRIENQLIPSGTAESRFPKPIQRSTVSIHDTASSMSQCSFAEKREDRRLFRR
jgi:hypothetical protein